MSKLQSVTAVAAAFRPKGGNQDTGRLVLQFGMLYIGRRAGDFSAS
jgi:hypothetical protein